MSSQSPSPNKVVIVTGGSQGVGLGISQAFLATGAAVVSCARKPFDACPAARTDDERARSMHVQADIRDDAQIDRVLEQTLARFGRLDVLVNNAGGQFPQASLDLSDKGWRAVVDTNLNGTWTMMQRAARAWQRGARGGSIVNIVAPYRRGMYGLAHTVAARAAVAHLAQNLAVEWAPLGIRINCVLPGPIATEGLAVYADDARAALAKSNPMHRLGDVQDVAEACVYLSAPSGKFVTGEILVVDGGHQLRGDLWMAGRPAWFAD